MRYEGVYTVPKDVLQGLLSRYDEAKVVRAVGGHVGASGGYAWPPTELGFFISLCFPRVSVAWEWLNGRRLAPASTCCSLECHWEEMLKVKGAYAAGLRPGAWCSGCEGAAPAAPPGMLPGANILLRQGYAVHRTQGCLGGG